MKKYLTIFLLLLVAEIVIAFYHFHPIVRGFIGDILVIPLLFCFVRIFFSIASERLVVYILLFAFIVEITQYYHLADALQIESKVLRTIMGSTFEITDLVAYLIGTCVTLLAEIFFRRKRSDSQ